MGTIYLIHFQVPFGKPQTDSQRLAYGLPPRRAGAPHQVQHYLGYTDDLTGRLAAHRAGNGSALMRAVAQAGIEWKLVRTWEGERSDERRLKNRKHARSLCPVCAGQICYTEVSDG